MARIYDIMADDLREVTQAEIDMLEDFIQTFGPLVMASKNKEIKKAVAGWKARRAVGENAHA